MLKIYLPVTCKIKVFTDVYAYRNAFLFISDAFTSIYT